ncbi:MAG: N-acetyltransferase [Flavobacteriales bacterium]|jgi:N-acetylglutamate synthase-like GNAT family acetyltransferase|nr:N-acetyltransferase [Flavobacteriales bacterium]
MENFITLDSNNIAQEHICCAISDKKCTTSYQAKKDWLKQEFSNGYVFRRIDARAKVFIEYGPAENAWLPIEAPNFLNINCFWVSGKYKKNGYGKQLLAFAIQDALDQGKNGLVTVVGTKKYHFMSDTKWLLKQGFKTIDQTADGFSLLVKDLSEYTTQPQFKACAKNSIPAKNKGIVVYYSNRCPFSEFHAKHSLLETAEKRNIPVEIIKLSTMEQAQNSPTPATIFSLFLDGKFITTDISVCMDSRYDKILAKVKK